MTYAALIYARCTVFEAAYQRHQVTELSKQVAALALIPDAADDLTPPMVRIFAALAFLCTVASSALADRRQHVCVAVDVDGISVRIYSPARRR